jgi:hypothetical protein
VAWSRNSSHRMGGMFLCSGGDKSKTDVPNDSVWGERSPEQPKIPVPDFVAGFRKCTRLTLVRYSATKEMVYGRVRCFGLWAAVCQGRASNKHDTCGAWRISTSAARSMKRRPKVNKGQSGTPSLVCVWFEKRSDHFVS